jgi:formate-dependent phosphoribosylglycinamide formyltransferase (GAR transformylase)
MPAIFFNYEPQEIVSEKIVGYDAVFVESFQCELYAFVSVTILHPTAPTVATLTTIEKRLIRRLSLKSSAKVRAAAYLLAHAVDNLKEVVSNLASILD